jgi:hypothetical protein
MKSPDYTSKPASEHTRAFNGSAVTPLDPEDFTRAQRGFIASLEDTKITDAQGRQAGDIGRYAFLQGDATTFPTSPLSRAIPDGLLLIHSPLKQLLALVTNSSPSILGIAQLLL